MGRNHCLSQSAPQILIVFIGDNSPSAQFGLIGKISGSGKKIALDLNGTNTISLFGVQGAGKSYSIGVVTEMVIKAFPNINDLSKPLAGVIFHYSDSEDYKPEFTSMIHPNDDERQLRMLEEQYGAKPEKLDDVVLLVPKDKMLQRTAEYPGITIRPIPLIRTNWGSRSGSF